MSNALVINLCLKYNMCMVLVMLQVSGIKYNCYNYVFINLEFSINLP